jgi:hypothetical protein
MKLERIVWYAAVLLLCVGPATARAQYLLTGGGGAQIQIGKFLPLPVGTSGIFLGGMTPVNGGTTCGNPVFGCSVSPDGPGTPFWPPLGIGPNPAATTGGPGTLTIQQTLGTPMGGMLLIPPGVLARPAAGNPVPIPVFPTNPALFQIATSISYAWPAASAVLGPGLGPAPAVFGTSHGGAISYSLSGAANAFGGAGRFAIQPGPGAGSGRVPPNAVGALPVASLWFNFEGDLPTSVNAVGIVGLSNPSGLAQPGAPVSAPGATTMFGPVLNDGMTIMTGTPPTMTVTPPFDGLGGVNIRDTMGMCVDLCIGSYGTIASSEHLLLSFPSNMVTTSKGFPWTTGLITVSQPNAVPPEIFFLSGTDMRVAGVGNISLVAGALSVRQLTDREANRGWLSLTLPEPSAALGATAALAALAVCHGCVRRRRARPA